MCLCHANSLPLSNVSVSKIAACIGLKASITARLVSAAVLWLMRLNLQNFVLRSTKVTTAPDPCLPRTKSPSQSPTRDFSSTIPGRCSISTRSFIQPLPAFEPRFWYFFPDLLRTWTSPRLGAYLYRCVDKSTMDIYRPSSPMHRISAPDSIILLSIHRLYFLSLGLLFLH